MANTEATMAGERVTGRVKWFNNKRGYGFITALTGETTGVDVFAHHSAIRTSNEQFLYLVQGEYVDFIMTPAEISEDVVDDDDEETTTPRWEASNITGFGGGKLMCETRNEVRQERQSTGRGVGGPRQGRGRGRGGAPRGATQQQVPVVVYVNNDGQGRTNVSAQQQQPPRQAYSYIPSQGQRVSHAPRGGQRQQQQYRQQVVHY